MSFTGCKVPMAETLHAARLLAGCALFATAGSCASSTFTVTTDHFSATFEPKWEFVVATGPALKTYIFRDHDDGIDVWISAWMEPTEFKDPTSEVANRLFAKARHRKTFGEIAPVQHCGTEGRSIRLFERDAPVREYMAMDDQYTVLAGGQAQGSLLGVLVRKHCAFSCETAEATARTVQHLLDGFSPSVPQFDLPFNIRPGAVPGRPEPDMPNFSRRRP